MNYYKCGHIMTTHGLKGDLKVKNLSDFDRFVKGSRLYILHNGEYYEVYISKAVAFDADLLVSFENMLDINLVEKFKGDDIYVGDWDREPLEEGSYYYSDLIGKEVYNQNGEKKGVVKEMRELPHCDYMVIDTGEKDKLVPFIKEFVIEVSDKIVVKEIEGLF